MPERKKEEKWIALLEVRAQGKLGETTNAFCTSIALASDEQQFEELARTTLAKMGFELMAIEEVELYRDRVLSFELSEECRTLAETTSDQQPIHFCTFHTYDE
ncbi:MAG: hypothetical protein KDD60_11290 [Bdellovibrionales bacterium]|nr:hypothetical protein [Bdellovibrionales bacterium]